ncbi:MAG: MaoC family dehydratase N-terminal domain-containing protein [Myxococcota bacterium]|nr:MaoC family dehydratase N-terminal domain-containing protein [Myxococcota bacterium]
MNLKLVGKQYGAFQYKIGLEKMREFSYVVAGGSPAIGFTGPPEGLNPLLWNQEAAKAGPHGEVIAFPTFCVTFAISAFSAAISDPELNLNLLMLVHGEQDFEFFDVMRDGDVMTTTGVIKDLYSRAGKDFVIVQTESKNQHGKLVVRGTWTAVVRNEG